MISDVAQPQEVEGGAEEVTQKDTQTVDSTEGRVSVSRSVSLNNIHVYDLLMCIVSQYTCS
jgi:hypothetical protein